MNGMVSRGINVRQFLSCMSPVRVLGDLERVVSDGAALGEADPNQLAFCNAHGERGADAISASRAGVIICHDDVPGLEQLAQSKSLITVGNPRLAFIRCMSTYFEKSIDFWDVHPTAHIEADAVVPARTKIGAHVYVGSGTEIGEGTIVGHGAVVESGNWIGKNVFIQSGAVIGCDSVAFERNEEGVLEKFPQKGWVVIEDDVEIGANTVIARGTFKATRIGLGTKIGNLVHIGHNADIGCHVMMSAGITIVGSARIGDFSWVGPGVVVRNSVHVGTNVTLGMGAVVTKHIEDNEVVMGAPARSRDVFIREMEWLEKKASGTE